MEFSPLIFQLLFSKKLLAWRPREAACENLKNLPEAVLTPYGFSELIY